MKQKINVRLVAIAILAIAATMVGITFVYYGLFQEQVRKDLRTEAKLLSATGIENLIENENKLEDKTLRITWISQEGKVSEDR